jgi:peptidoglycan/xylan/chitin deacetylase (PgdA/CDA1 family)
MSLIKKGIKEGVGWGVRRTYFRSRLPKGLNVILMYHRVVDALPGGMYEPAVFVTARTFEMHLEELSKVFELVPLTDLVRYGRREKGLCAITFDDGWLDTYEVAFPILKRHRAPAAVFVPTGLVGTANPFWFEDLMALANRAAGLGEEGRFIRWFSRAFPAWEAGGLGMESVCALTAVMKRTPGCDPKETVYRAYRDLGVERPAGRDIIGWEHMAEMSRGGISFGPHGSRHRILPLLDRGMKREEIFGPLEVLRDPGISFVPVFSYPNGDWDEECLAMVREAGYAGAVSTRFGYNGPHTDPFLLRRIGLHDYISFTPSLFWFRMCQAFFG